MAVRFGWADWLGLVELGNYVCNDKDGKSTQVIPNHTHQLYKRCRQPSALVQHFSRTKAAASSTLCLTKSCIAGNMHPGQRHRVEQ